MTNIFISSTCYDLSQIRKDLFDGISALGHHPILSESKDFPIDPNLTTAENCIEAVKKDADIFVLIIGNKYGSPLKSGKSITNSEFEAALMKGIPIYTFSLKQMVAILPVWKKNPSVDFGNIVDNNKIFEFLEDVRSKQSLWNFEFENAQDILEILRTQLSHLLHSSLEAKKRIDTVDRSLFNSVSGKALGLLTEKPDNYEIRMLFQMISDSVNRKQDLKRDCEHSIIIKAGPSLSDVKSLSSWLSIKTDQLDKFIESFNNLFSAINYFYSTYKDDSDIDGLSYIARRYGDLYGFMLEWVIDVRSVIVPDSFKAVVLSLSELPLKPIQQMEEFPSKALERIDEAETRLIEGVLDPEKDVLLSLKLTVDDEFNERFNKELAVLTSKMRRGEVPVF